MINSSKLKEYLVILIPTYNENRNIGEIIEYIEKEIIKKIKDFRISILVVDSKSTDGTIEIVNEKIDIYSNILLNEGEKAGLGEAYKRGVKFAIKKMGADLIIKMDADFQHNPKYIFPLLEGYRQGYNYVTGSRYCAGGSLVREWSLFRRFLSKYGGLFVRILLFFPRVKILTDISSGFALGSVKKVFEKIDLNRLSNSFSYTHQLVYLIVKIGIKIKEIPIKFEVREKGNSKLHIDIIIRDLIDILIFRMRNWRY